MDHPITNLLEKYTVELKKGTAGGRLFDAGSFPAAIASDDSSDVIHGELFTIKDTKAVIEVTVDFLTLQKYIIP